MKKYLRAPYHSDKRGFTLLTSVLILGVVSSSIVFSVLLFGVDSERLSFTYERHAMAKNFSDGCVEEALQEIRESVSYTGTVTRSFGEGNCEATVSDTGGQTRRIESTGTVDDVTHRVLVTVSQINPLLEIQWQDIDDF